MPREEGGPEVVLAGWRRSAVRPVSTLAVRGSCGGLLSLQAR